MMTTPDVSQQNNSATDLDSNNIDKNEIVTQSVSKGEFFNVQWFYLISQTIIGVL